MLRQWSDMLASPFEDIQERTFQIITKLQNSPENKGLTASTPVYDIQVENVFDKF